MENRDIPFSAYFLLICLILTMILSASKAFAQDQITGFPEEGFGKPKKSEIFDKRGPLDKKERLLQYKKTENFRKPILLR